MLFRCIGIEGVYKKDYEVSDAGYLSDEGVLDKKRFTGSTIGIYGIGFENSYDFSYELMGHHIEENAYEYLFNR